LYIATAVTTSHLTLLNMGVFRKTDLGRYLSLISQSVRKTGHSVCTARKDRNPVRTNPITSAACRVRKLSFSFVSVHDNSRSTHALLSGDRLRK
jgi:hypothetical protein